MMKACLWWPYINVIPYIDVVSSDVIKDMCLLTSSKKTCVLWRVFWGPTCSKGALAALRDEIKKLKDEHKIVNLESDRLKSSTGNPLQLTPTRCNTLQHTTTHCNTLQHTATHCSTLQHTATHCNTLQRTATHCNTRQHTATHCNKSISIFGAPLWGPVLTCNCNIELFDTRSLSIYPTRSLSIYPTRSLSMNETRRMLRFDVMYLNVFFIFWGDPFTDV